MKNAAAFKGTYADWKLIRTRNCVQVVFEIPLEEHDTAYQALGGMPDPGKERWFGIARLAERENVTAGASLHREAGGGSLGNETGAPASRPRKAITLAQQAGMCCENPLFSKFLEHKFGGPIADVLIVARFVRSYCGVNSRSEIKPNTVAGNHWRNLHSEFLIWRDNPDLVPDHPRADCQNEREQIA